MLVLDPFLFAHRVCKNLFELLEVRPLAWLVGPALSHYGVELGRTAGRKCQPFAGLKLADHFRVLDALEGLHAQHENLPHTNAFRQEKERERERYYLSANFKNAILLEGGFHGRFQEKGRNGAPI